MNPDEYKQQLIVELRKLRDRYLDQPEESQNGLNASLLAKSIAELRQLSQKLGLPQLDSKDKTSLVYQIQNLVLNCSQYRTIEGRLDILPDGSAFLSSVSFYDINETGQKSDDPNDIYRISVPSALLSEFSLKQNDLIGGLRRWPYTTDGEADLVLLRVYAVNHVPVKPKTETKTISPSLKAATRRSPAHSPVAPSETTSLSARPEPQSEATERSHGPCEQCEHMRVGLSVARPAFDAVLEVLKTKVQTSYNQKTQEERQMAAEFVSERETNQQYNTIEYTRRPTVPHFMYCGVEEFSGRAFCCEVKNLDNRCDQFTPKASLPVPHACKTCVHHLAPSSKWVQTAEQVSGAQPKGQPVRESIRQTLQLQADTEYQTCVDAIGIVPSRPGTLPYCDAHSANDDNPDPRYVIGPIVNAGERCARWKAGSHPAINESLSVLAKLVARGKQADHESKFPSVMSGDPAAAASERQRIAGNAQADVIEFCLRSLGVESGFIESACTQYAADVWYTVREKYSPDTADISSPAPSADADPAQASNAPSQPIQVTINSVYRHPKHNELTLTIYQYPPWFTAQIDMIGIGGCDLFDLSRFQNGVWTTLQGRRGPIPMALMVVGPPYNQFYVTWL
ncbi:MAG TPA: hypothetical protein VIM69_13465 [Opitutaceae bacterium]